jgi:hypothetical protein
MAAQCTVCMKRRRWILARSLPEAHDRVMDERAGARGPLPSARVLLPRLGDVLIDQDRVPVGIRQPEARGARRGLVGRAVPEQRGPRPSSDESGGCTERGFRGAATCPTISQGSRHGSDGRSPTGRSTSRFTSSYPSHERDGTRSSAELHRVPGRSLTARAARGGRSAPFGRRRIPAAALLVAQRLPVFVLLAPLSAGRLAGLGATRYFPTDCWC